MENKKYIPGAKTTSGKTGEVVSEGGYGEGDASLTTGARRREMSQGDYSLILESLVKSDASESKLANYLSSKGIDDADVEILLAERKKKRAPETTGYGSLATGMLQFPETEKLLNGYGGASITRSQQGIQSDIQNNEENKKVIEKTSYNSFLEYTDAKKDIIADSEYDTPNDVFELLVDKDSDFLDEVEPFQNAVNRVDLKIAKELNILEAYEKGLLKSKSKKKLQESWAPFSGSAASNIKLSKEQRQAQDLVYNTLNERGIPFAREGDTDDPAQKAAEIRDKYRAKYGTEFSQVFQKNFKGKIPEKYANDPIFLEKVEDYMHMQNSSVDLNGDGRIYQRGTAASRGANQAVLSVYEWTADFANVIADKSGNKALIKAASEVKQQIADNKRLEGSVEYNEFSLAEFVKGEGGTVTGLLNKSIGLTAQSLPYMAGVGVIQKSVAKKGLTMMGSNLLARYTASTVGMGTISAAGAYSNGMGQDWFEEMSGVGKLAYSSVHGLAEGAGETVSFAVFSKILRPLLNSGAANAKKTVSQFIMGGVKSYGFQVSEEIAAESGTAVVQSIAEIIAKGEEVTYEKINDRLYEAIEGAILMTSALKGGTGIARAPFELQSLHLGKFGIGDTKLRSRALIRKLSDEYENADEKSKGIIGAQLAKALANESQRTSQNSEYYEMIREKSPDDWNNLIAITDSFQKKVDQWNSMPEGAAKFTLAAEIKADFQTKLDIESKYSADAVGKTQESAKAPEGATTEAAGIATKIFQGEELTMEEESFYAENQAEVEKATEATTANDLFTPFKMESGKVEATTEVTEENGTSVIDNLVESFEAAGEDVFTGYKTTKEKAIRGLVSIKNAIKAIRTVNPDAKVFIHTSGKAFKEATGLEKLSRGFYTSGNEVHFLAPAMVSTTGYHESTHAAFMETLGEKSYSALFGEISKMVKNSAGVGGVVGQTIQNFISGYESKDRGEEGVTEFISMLADGQFDIEIEKGLLRKIAETIGEKLGFKVPIPSRTQGVQIMKDIAGSLKEGTPIDPDKVGKLKVKKDKGQENKGKAQKIDSEVQNIAELMESDDKVFTPSSSVSFKPTKGKSQQMISEVATDIIKNNIVKVSNLNGEKIPLAVFYDNTRVGKSGVANTLTKYQTGNSFNGGFGYSFRGDIDFNVDGKKVKPIMAFTGEAEAAKLLKQVSSKDGNLIPLVNQNNETGHLGNLDTREELFGKAGHFTHVESQSKKAKKDVVSALQESLRQAKNFTGKDVEKSKIAAALQTINIDGIKSVADFNDFVMSGAINSFGLRNKFLQDYILLKKRGKKPSASTTPVRALAYTYGIPTISELSDGMTEPAFQNAELGDVIAFVRPDKTPVVYTTDEKYKDGVEKDMNGFKYKVIYSKELSKHNSYPFVIGGENVGFADKYVDITTVFEDLKDIKKTQSYYKAGRRGLSAQSGSIEVEIATTPDTDEFSQYKKLASTPEGKAQIIGSLGAKISQEKISNLALARGLENGGKEAKAIFFATGWYRGLDNLWRTEIDYGFIPNTLIKKIKEFSEGDTYSKPLEFKISDILVAKELFEAYPDIAESKLTFKQLPKNSRGSYNPGTGEIQINISHVIGVGGKINPQVVFGTLFHEIQHSVQSIEGFTSGFSPSLVARNLSQSPARTPAGHKKVYTEVEALADRINGYGFEVVNKFLTDLREEYDTPYIDNIVSRYKNSEDTGVLSADRGLGNLVKDIYKSGDKGALKKGYLPREVSSGFVVKVLQEIAEVSYSARMQEKMPAKEKKSTEMLRRRMGLDSDLQTYKRNAGESEARQASQRQSMKKAERASTFPMDGYPEVSMDEIWAPNEIMTALSKAAVGKVKASKQTFLAEKKYLGGDTAFYEKRFDDLKSKLKEVAVRVKDGKSQLIEGTQSFDLLKKEVQEILIKEGIENFSENNTGVYRLFEHLRYKWADKYQPLQNLQSSIEKAQSRQLRTDSNFRRAEALMHGMAANDARLFEENQLKPLMDKMIEYKVTNEQLSEYLYSLHAFERNEFVKNTIDPANEDGSGMSNEVAEEIKKKYASNKDQMDELAKQVYGITTASRKLMLNSGLITPTQFAAFDMFENYIPLVGTAITPTSDLFDFTDSRSSSDVSRGSGIAIFGKEYKSVSGRFSEAQSPLESVISNHLRTISRARKNEVLQTLLTMVTENKDSKTWEVFTEKNPDMKVRIASKGVSILIEEVTGEDYEYTLRRKMAGIAMAGNSDYVPVKVMGKTSYIKFADSRITKILNDGGVGKTSVVVQYMSKAARHFTRVFTSWNPEFIVANLARDVQTAMFNQMAEQDMELSNISGKNFVGETLRTLPTAIKGVYQFEMGKRDKMDSETKDYYEEYLAAGAKTDWFLLKTPEQIEKEMLQYVDKMNPVTNDATLREKSKALGKAGLSKFEDIKNLVENTNTSIENGIRFSAYMAARRNGVDVDKAAEFVKELTINFNRSGEMGPLANSLYLFFNASVQGSTRLMRSLVKSNKARKVAAGMMAFSALNTMRNIMVGGEDEDGIPFYEKIPSYERERFLIVMTGTNNYVKIPLPYGVSIFFNMGTTISELGSGVTTAGDAAGFMAGSIIGSFAPISPSKSSSFSGSLIKTVTPTIFKPIPEIGLNENFFGSPIYKEDFAFGATTPESSRFKKSTSEWSKSMTSFLNQATGGNEFEPGFIDVNPDIVEYLFNFVGGGSAKFLNRTIGTADKMIDGEKFGKKGDIEWNDVPLARQFIGTVRESESAGRYYETRRELLQLKNKAKGAIKAGKPITLEMKELGRLLKAESTVQARVKKLGQMERAAMKIEDADKRKEALDIIHDRKMKAYETFNSFYYKSTKK